MTDKIERKSTDFSVAIQLTHSHTMTMYIFYICIIVYIIKAATLSHNNQPPTMTNLIKIHFYNLLLAIPNWCYASNWSSASCAPNSFGK